MQRTSINSATLPLFLFSLAASSVATISGCTPTVVKPADSASSQPAVQTVRIPVCAAPAVIMLPSVDPLQIAILNARTKCGLLPSAINRGPELAEFAGRIESYIRDDGLKLTNFDLVLLIGPPDRYHCLEDKQLQYLYTYKVPGIVDQAIVFIIDASGFVEGRVGINRADAPHYKTWDVPQVFPLKK